jgi:hypothetical protein
MMTRDEAIELQQSLNWKAFEKELKQCIQMDTYKILNEKDINAIIRLQERIKVFGEVIELPNNIAEREE